MALRALVRNVSPLGVLARSLHTTPCVLAAKIKGPLTDDAISQFHKDGYILCKTLLSAQDKANIAKWTDEIQAWPETKGKWMEYFEQHDGKRMLCRTENFIDYHEPLAKLCEAKLKQAVAQLFGEDTVLFKEKINYKFPGAAGFKPHQDAPAWVTFNQTRHITAMIAADAADEENGCLFMVKGEHLKGTFPHPEGSMEEDLCAKWKWNPLIVDVGDVAFFDSYTPHRSYDNKSKRPRRVYYITYNPTTDGDYRAAYFEDKRQAFPPDIERVPGKDYSAGARVYNVANPIPNKTM